MLRPCLGLLLAATGAAERIDHAGRILPPTPAVTAPILFHTPAADAVLASLQFMPVDSAWNERADRLPLLPNSAAMVARISSDLAADRRALRAFHEMNLVLVPQSQPRVEVRLFAYPDESDDLKPGSSDLALYPFPANTPIEGWPAATGALSLAQWQQDVNNDGGDRHAIVLQPHTGLFWETWQTRDVPSATPRWQAANGARWDLASNAQRPLGWTSADAAGLPMLPALVRYDEVQRGAVEHALRLIVKRTRREYVYPASHHASNPSTTDPDVPAMGQRLRLRGDYAIPAGWSAESRCVARALQKYGGLVADNGNFFSLSVTPDDRWPDACFDDLRTLRPTDFEVVQGTTATGGPRAPGAPRVDAGPDLIGTVGGGVQLSAAVTGSGTVRWQAYPHAPQPGTVSLAAPAAASTAAAFSATGTYTLLVSVDDGVHAVAYDAVQVVVAAGGDGQPPGFTGGTVRLSGPVPAGAVSVRAGGVPADIAVGRYVIELDAHAGTVVLEAVAADGRVSARTVRLQTAPAGGG